HYLEDAPSISFSSKVRDISQVLAGHADELKPLLKPLPLKATFHDSCHIAHSQGIRKEPRDLIRLVPGLTFIELENADACCGSGGTYNIVKPEMADRILHRKLDTIRATGADVVVTGNPGCMLQLKKGLMDHLPQVRMMHLTELLEKSMDA
ncbi:MAG: (Fe-S)-binding protein, partial [Desulfobacula sp.]